MYFVVVANVAQVAEQVSLCSEGQWFELCHGRRVLGQDTYPSLPRVDVYDCCMFVVVVGGAVGAEWQPHVCQSVPR